MAREPHIPLFLWVATAVLIHLVSGGGADQAATVLSERLDVKRFAQSVRAHVRARSGPIEIALLNDDERDEPSGNDPDVPPEEAQVADEVEPERASAEPNRVAERTKEPETEPVEEDTRKRPEETKATPPEPKPEQKKKEEEPEEPKTEKPQDLPVIKLKNRIAVEQHVEDQQQEDNPEAEFIGDHANRVEEQTQARITATDQNDPSPTPGTAHAGPSDQPGNAHVTDVAHSEDVEGEADKAPREEQAKAEREKQQAPTTEVKGGGNPNADKREATLEKKTGKADGAAKGASNASGPAQEARDAIASSRAVEASLDVHHSKEGTFTMGRAREGQAAQLGQAERKRRLPPRKGQTGPLDFLGLGAEGTTRGGLNLNLSQEQAVAAIGRDQLALDREADGERRRSKHRGSWKTMGIERWRAAIENYNSSVKPGNQTALNTARVPFASYLNHIHGRLHPIFADSFLASLDGLPREHPLNRPDMKTNLEIVVSQMEGKIVKMGITASSGSTVFDIAALESVQSASPFGKAPSVIASNDGNVYLHWEFHRNPYYACSTYFARPYIINVEQEPAPSNLPSPLPPFRPSEDPVDRDGYLNPRLLPRFETERHRHVSR
jgi:hypothetical protein